MTTSNNERRAAWRQYAAACLAGVPVVAGEACAIADDMLAAEDVRFGKVDVVAACTDDELSLIVLALRSRGVDLVAWAWRDGDDLRVRGEAMIALSERLEAEL